MLEYADLLENLELNDSRLNNELLELRNRANNLKNYGNDYYTLREKKRIYYESEKMSKADMVSYDTMISRRKDDDDNGILF